MKEALINSNVSFSLELDGKKSINTSGKDIENTILELFGKSVLRNIRRFEYGYLGNVEILKSSKDYIFTYVNRRYVKSSTIERAVIDGYYTKLMKGKFPFAIIFLDIDPREIDVNVHPSKKIVKFSNDKVVYRQIKDAIDEFFYHNDRENWQPNIDLLKQNVNVENKDEKIKDLFSDEIIRADSQPFFSLETDSRISYKKEQEEDREESLSVGEGVYRQGISESGLPGKDIEDVMKELELSETGNEGKKGIKNGITETGYSIPDSKTGSDQIAQEQPEYRRGTFEKHEGRQFEYDVLGQIFNTYILVRKDNELEIYDQHIIHERILYEELKERFYSKRMESRNLLLPQKMEINEVEKHIIFDNMDIFNDFGFDIDELQDEIVFRAVPDFEFRESIQEVLLKLLSDIREEKEIKDLRENIIISMSCKGAVKAGQKLSMDEMRNMVRRLHEVGEYTCPHGRPIIVKITRDDLDKMFGRKK